MRSKYGNNKIVNSFGKFDSEIEWARFIFLSERTKKGEISNLRRQVAFTLIPNQYGTEIRHLKTKDKEIQVLLERACVYIADFVYERDGKTIVEDCKGEDKRYKGKRFSTQTADFKIKKKLMLYVHHIQIKIVSEPTSWEKT